jgi:glycine cleavage system H protein
MPKWRTVRVSDELLAAVESVLKTSDCTSLSEFVADAVRLHLDELRHSRGKKPDRATECPIIPDRLLYSRDHMWAMVTPEGNVRLGLSDFAQSRMDGIVRVQVERIGCEIEKGKPFGNVETWMFKFDLHSPVIGKIIKVNEAIINEPFIINKDPYETGWIAEVKPNNLIALEEELRDLMRPDQYKTWISRLRHSMLLGT